MDAKVGNFIFETDNEESLLTFSDENIVADTSRWKVMIVDDDRNMHKLTKQVLNNFTFDDKFLTFISAYSPEEGMKLIRRHPDTAVILLDVMMKNEKSGLTVVKYIREVAKNHLVRIILRTGQPSEAPEEMVIRNYDINDYKEKTELTAQKLATTMISSLRSYRDMVNIDNHNKGLEKMFESSAALLEAPTLHTLAACILANLVAILAINMDRRENSIFGLVAIKEDGAFKVVDGTGKYKDAIGDTIDKNSSFRYPELITKTPHAKIGKYIDNCFIQHFYGKNQYESLIYLEGLTNLTSWEKKLISIFGITVSATFDSNFLTKEIEDTQKEIIFTLGEFSETRSQETGNHVRRVAEYSRLLALKYGLSPEEADLLKLASPMHDVGKLGISDVILNKPGKLTPEEFEAIKAHGSLGYEILRSSNRKIMQVGALVALQHHEKYDGTGYPNGLKGEEIHIYGRITALADVFDALGSDRVYKKAWPLSDVLNYLKVERGKHFDPRLVDIFCDNLQEFLQIRDAFQDIAKC